MSCFYYIRKLRISGAVDTKVLTMSNFKLTLLIDITVRHSKITIYIQFVANLIFLGAVLTTSQSALVAVSVFKLLRALRLFHKTSLKEEQLRLTFSLQR